MRMPLAMHISSRLWVLALGPLALAHLPRHPLTDLQAHDKRRAVASAGGSVIVAALTGDGEAELLVEGDRRRGGAVHFQKKGRDAFAVKTAQHVVHQQSPIAAAAIRGANGDGENLRLVSRE